MNKQDYKVQHILLADDDRDHGFLFKKTLLKEFPGVDIQILNESDRLLPYLHLHPVDLLFLDLNMPCKNGYECLQELKNDPALQDLPIIVYSSSAHLYDIQRSFLHRADFYLVKPFRTDHLRTALKTILAFNWKEDPPIRQHYFINNRFVPYTATG